MIERQRRRQPRGYVLIMTLLLIAMAATAMATVASESHRRALAAVRAQDELQRRWGAISCQQALLPRAADVLKSAPARGTATKDAGAPVVYAPLTLGRMTFAVAIADEQAKVNVNVLATKLEGSRLHDTLQDLLPARSTAALRLAPSRKVMVETDGTRKDVAHFGSYGQLLPQSRPAELMGDGRTAAPLAANFTCWGDGTLNVSAASPAALDALLGTLLDADQVKQFKKSQADLRGSGGAGDLKQAFDALNLPPDRREALDKLITTDGTCPSIWIAADLDGATSYRFAVAPGGGADSAEVFEW